MAKLALPDSFVVFDMEWTAWEGSQERNWSGPNEYREIYDIGAVKVEGKEFNMVDTFRQLVTLELVPELPQYSVKLTGISQQEIDESGVSFSDMVRDFAAFSEKLDIYAWGTDGDFLAENCQLKNVANPFSPERFHNMREVFKDHDIPADDYMSSTIVEHFGQQNKHTAHQGLDDAQNIVEAVRLLDKQD